MARFAVLSLACLIAMVAVSDAKAYDGQCYWAGRAPICRPGGCPSGYVISGGSAKGDGHRCWSGEKYLCCKVGSDRAQSERRRNGCFWSGTGPYCKGSCPTSYRSVHFSKRGDGKRCSSGYKLRCCPTEIQ